MTIEDVVAMLNRYVVGNDLAIGDGQLVPVGQFAQLFASAPARPCRADLDAIDGGSLGYAQFIAVCHADGIIE